VCACVCVRALACVSARFFLRVSVLVRVQRACAGAPLRVRATAAARASAEEAVGGVAAGGGIEQHPRHALGGGGGGDVGQHDAHLWLSLSLSLYP
jgi:hypothetical protein